MVRVLFLGPLMGVAVAVSARMDRSESVEVYMALSGAVLVDKFGSVRVVGLIGSCVWNGFLDMEGKQIGKGRIETSLKCIELCLFKSNHCVSDKGMCQHEECRRKRLEIVFVL